MKILLASGNRNKLVELRAALAPLGIELLSPEDVGGLPEVVEDRDSFAGNAEKKAASAARASGHWALSDDSGLEVDALDGAPGVRSARYAGPASDDAANNARLLRELDAVPEERRSAHFVCLLALCDPGGRLILTARGEAHGRILRERRGASGFGYDPLFLFTEPGFAATGSTFAELGLESKGAVSHRGRAIEALVADLPGLLADSPTSRPAGS